jgi:hypothetical protein
MKGSLTSIVAMVQMMNPSRKSEIAAQQRVIDKLVEANAILASKGGIGGVSAALGDVSPMIALLSADEKLQSMIQGKLRVLRHIIAELQESSFNFKYTKPRVDGPKKNGLGNSQAVPEHAKTGCTYPNYKEFSALAEVDDGSCKTPVVDGQLLRDIFHALGTHESSYSIPKADVAADSNADDRYSPFISEYVPGYSWGCQAIELFNPGCATIESDTLALWVVPAGKSWSMKIEVPLGPGSVDGASTLVVCSETGLAATMEKLCDIKSAHLRFDGSQAIGLAVDGILVDAIGTENEDVSENGWTVAGESRATKKNSLIRKPQTQFGNQQWGAVAEAGAESSQWQLQERNSFAHLGHHEYDFGGLTCIMRRPQPSHAAPPPPARVQLSLDSSVESIGAAGSTQRRTWQGQVVSDLAKAMKISATRIKDVKVQAGSVLVQLEIGASEGSVLEPDPATAASELQKRVLAGTLGPVAGATVQTASFDGKVAPDDSDEIGGDSDDERDDERGGVGNSAAPDAEAAKKTVDVTRYTSKIVPGPVPGATPAPAPRLAPAAKPELGGTADSEPVMNGAPATTPPSAEAKPKGATASGKETQSGTTAAGKPDESNAQGALASVAAPAPPAAAVDAAASPSQSSSGGDDVGSSRRRRRRRRKDTAEAKRVGESAPADKTAAATSTGTSALETAPATMPAATGGETEADIAHMAHHKQHTAVVIGQEMKTLLMVMFAGCVCISCVAFSLICHSPTKMEGEDLPLVAD